MKRPFNIFPSIGYRNSQFQIVSSVDNLKIDIYDQDKVVKTIEANFNHPTLLTSLNATGKLIAKCKFDNVIFQQELEIKEAFRLGSSEFKKAFVFDDTDYSFFLMKDRLLLYDEKRRILFTENHYSPTEIYKINKTNFLFVTKVGSSETGIINLGIYNLETFSIVGELLNDYREIKLLPDNNKVWLYNIKSKTIHCYELTQQINGCFTELKAYIEFSNFFLDDPNQNIYINCDEDIKIANLSNLQKSIVISKTATNAIDILGNVFTSENSKLICTNIFSNFSVTVKTEFEVNLLNENFIHLGQNLTLKEELTDLSRKVDEIKIEVVSSIPENKATYFLELPEHKRMSETYTTHSIFPTIGGVFIIQKEVKREFNGITFKKYEANWMATACTNENSNFTLFYFSSDKMEILLEEAANLIVSGYHNSMLLVNSLNTNTLFIGCNKFVLVNDSTIKLFTINEMAYILIKYKEKYSLYFSSNLKEAILDQIEILNPNLIEEHQIIWYIGKEKYLSSTNYLSAFDLKVCSIVFFDEKIVQHSIFKDATDFKFYDRYALSSNQIVFNPKSLEFKDAFIGIFESYSEQLNKIVSHRTNVIYLSVYSNLTGKFELTEIPIENHKYNASYFSPNGQFLVLQEENNRYIWYDIGKNETIKFILGNFLAFRNDGSLIVEEDSTKAVKIFDPITFQDITPANYHHYRFMSPDGKLYAQVASKVRYFDKLNNKELTVKEVTKYRQDLDEPNIFLQGKERDQAKSKLEINRQQIFYSNKQKFKELGVEDFVKINSNTVVRVEKYTEIGIVGTNVLTEILFPEDLVFYNYSAFSYDNKYFGYVGKPPSNGLIHLIRIDFDEVNSKLKVIDTYLSRYPRYASWVCGFSKTGYFATYDSTPDTYIINVAENLFDNKTSEMELRENIYKSRLNLYHTYSTWNEIMGKNFLCFSPTGNYLALSEQGYEPLTLGGYGHQESAAVHIADTKTGEIIESFTDHGTYLVNPQVKDTIFVSFSEDESRLMTMSKDGVVIIRDIKIGTEKQVDKIPGANTRLAAIGGVVDN